MLRSSKRGFGQTVFPGLDHAHPRGGDGHAALGIAVGRHDHVTDHAKGPGHGHGLGHSKHYHEHHVRDSKPAAPENTAPVIVSHDAYVVPENGTAVGAVRATDREGDALAYSIKDGADAHLFTVDARTGALSFVSPPDFEAAADRDADNVYQLTVAVTDGTSTVTKSVTVAVQDVNEAPAFLPNDGFTIEEGSTAVGCIVASDPEGDEVTYAITAGADALLFCIDPATGELAFLAPPDFHAPGDAGADNAYDLTVTASDGTLSTSRDVTVQVTAGEREPAPEPAPNPGPAPNQAPVITGYTDFTRTGPVVLDVGGGAVRAGIRANEKGAIGVMAAIDPDGDMLDFRISGGADADLFRINPAGVLSVDRFLTATGSADGDFNYEVQLSVTDPFGEVATLDLTYYLISFG